MSAQVHSFFHAPTCTWSHVVHDTDSKAAAIVDPVLDFDLASVRVDTESARALLAYVKENELSIEWILETHAHADHLSAADWLKNALAKAGVSAKTGIGAGIVSVQEHF